MLNAPIDNSSNNNRVKEVLEEWLKDLRLIHLIKWLTLTQVMLMSMVTKMKMELE